MSSDWPIRFRLDGRPQGKERPRLGKGRVFTPRKTKLYEEAIGWQARIAMKGKKPIDGPVRVSIMAAFRGDPGVFCNNKVDLDNICKACLDGMNGIVMGDDRQVVEIKLMKIHDIQDYISIEAGPLT